MHVKRVHRSRQELAVTASEICNYRQLTSSFQRVVELASFGTQPETRKLQQVCRRLVYLTVIKSISGCVRITCSGLMITSLLQVVNRLDAS